MSDVPAKPGNKSFVGIFFIVLILFGIGMYYYVPDRGNDFAEQNVVQNLDSLAYSFQALATGDIIGFIDNLVGAIPVIALFLVMFGILHFLFSGALKKLFGKKKYATTLSFVVAVYGFVDHRIYNYLLNANAFMVGFLVFSVLIIFIWGLTKQSSGSVKESFSEAELARKGTTSDKEHVRKLKKELQELENEKY